MRSGIERSQQEEGMGSPGSTPCHGDSICCHTCAPAPSRGVGASFDFFHLNVASWALFTASASAVLGWFSPVWTKTIIECLSPVLLCDPSSIFSYFF